MAMDVLHTMANLKPVHLLRVTNTACKMNKRPLHDLMHTNKISPNTAKATSTTKQSTLKIQIATTKQNAIEEEARDRADVKVYTDGSGMVGMIGAGAVLYRSGVEKATSRYRLGTEEQHTVYESECMGTAMGVKLISNEWNFKTATICTDNQAAIRKAIHLGKKAPGHHILDAFHRELDKLQKTHQGVRITLRWTPGHKGIEGNERADKEAKRAITKGSSRANTLPTVFEKKPPSGRQMTKK